MRRFGWFTLCGVLLAGPAFADGTIATCEVRAVQASQPAQTGAAPTFDAKISRLKPFLDKAPFNSWHRFDLIGSQTIEVPLHESRPFSLAGLTGTLTFVEHVLDAGKHRLRLQLQSQRIRPGCTPAPAPNGSPCPSPASEGHRHPLNTTFVLDEAGVVLQAGRRKEGGMLITAVTCTSR